MKQTDEGILWREQVYILAHNQFKIIASDPGEVKTVGVSEEYVHDFSVGRAM